MQDSFFQTHTDFPECFGNDFGKQFSKNKRIFLWVKDKTAQFSVRIKFTKVILHTLHI